MEILLYREGAEKIETGFTVEQLPDLLKDEKAVIWVDMFTFRTSVRAQLAI